MAGGNTAPLEATTPLSGPPAGAAGAGRGRALLETLLRNPLVVVFAVVFVVLSLATDAFLSKTNLLNILEANADIGIVACAATILIVAGGLDVSVGAIYALAGVVSAKVAISSGVPLGLLAGIGIGLAAGVFNGVVTTIGKVGSFVATLASGIMFLSLAQVITGANLLTPEQESYTDLGRNELLGLKWIVWMFLVIAIISGVLLGRATFGRRVRAVGANAEAARLSGVSVPRVVLATFAFSGLTAGLAGVVLASQSGQATTDVGGIPFVLSVIAAVAIGGTSLRGGEGAVWRTVLGVLFLGMVTNGLHLLHVDGKYDSLFVGLLILLAAAAQVLARRLSRPDQ